MTAEDFDRLNWVERRARIEQTLDRDAPGLWESVRAALQDAFNSFKEHYPTQVQGLECTLEEGARLVFTRKGDADEDTSYGERVVISYYDDERAIEVTENRHRQVFRIRCDRDGVYACLDNQRVTPDQLSEQVLRHVFFPRQRK
jgi:hypothetical protein